MQFAPLELNHRGAKDFLSLPEKPRTILCLSLSLRVRACLVLALDPIRGCSRAVSSPAAAALGERLRRRRSSTRYAALSLPYHSFLFRLRNRAEPKLCAFGSECLTQLLVYTCIIPTSSDFFWQNYWVSCTARPWIRQMG